MGWLLTIAPTTAQQVQKDSTQTRLDSLNQRRLSPSFLLWQNMRTNPLFPTRNPFLYQRSPLLPVSPLRQEVGVKVDSTLRYQITEQLDSTQVGNAQEYDFERFSEIQQYRVRQDYWRTRARGMDGESAVEGRSLIPPLTVSPSFDRIFGGSEINITPTGYVNLDFGAIFRRVDNPTLPIRQQQNGGFNFQQQIQMAVNGNLGEKMKIAANFDSNNSFDFQNQLKLEYDGFEEDIIQSIEVGNVSMPVQNRLIQGAQNLFGLKTQMKFGKLNVTAVASTQRGRRDNLVIDANGQGRTFEIQGSRYDENRHFFLSHFFRDNYERWLRGLPQVLSGVNITRIEVYIMNRATNTQTLRNFAAFMDLGEGRVLLNGENPSIGPGNPNSPAANGANALFGNITSNPAFRPFDTGSRTMESVLGLRKGVDFEQINGARKLNPDEFFFNKELGFVSLFRRLQNDEVIAVSYEYTYNGQVFKVGELTEDYQSRNEDELIFLKLLRPARINPQVPTWDLMMKNVYSLNASRILRDGFQLQVIYRDDRTGLDNPSLLEGATVKDVPLIRLTGLDNLNPQNDPAPDGNFDFVEGITMISERGLLIFPVLEPFGSNLERRFTPEELVLKEKYVYDTLYRTTQADAELVTRLNKFFIKGRLTAGSASEIQLPGLNISPGSVIVTAGNIPLTEGVDFTIDYNVGRLVIINDAILQSGKQINVSFEKADLVSFQTRSLLGTRLDYLASKKLNIGGTFLYLNERPNITRIATGNETLRNSLWGLDVNFNDESRFLTKLADALPFTDTKEKSLVQFNAEFAHLIPGTSNTVNGDPASYIDDFEAAVTPFNLGAQANQTWKLAATPKTPDNRFDLSNQTEDNLGNAYRRARIAWYNIDNIFYREGGPGVPTNLTPEDRRNHYVRRVIPQEIFRNQDRDVIIVPQPLFEMAYFPSERGMFNYNPNLTSDGFLPNPRQNYGGVTRAITTEVDFDRTNIEYIEFWLLDPFIQGQNGRVLDGIFNQNNTTGGKLLINLGDISEDIMRDGAHSFENGLPADGDPANTNQNEWGRITREQFLIPAFDNSESSRQNQDVGLDGLRNEDEPEYFRSRFLDRINVNQQALNTILQDVSGDQFQYYLDESFDQADVKILERYKKFNGMEGNTPVSADPSLPYTPSGTNNPDNEDLNTDNTINELENYYEYEIDLRPGQLQVGQNYIVDQVTTNQNGDEVNWYLFRIPVRQPDRVEGNITGFKSIRWMRTYLTDFSQPVVLRMAEFRMVGSQWRVFQESLFERGFFEIPEPDNSNVVVDVVNIEQNSQGSDKSSPYVLPPGIIRDRDNTSTVERRLNEQSLRICVEDLAPRDARAVFKNINYDLVQYERIKMFLHANSEDAQDGEVTAFLRMGTDYTDNYYEIEVPLVISPLGTNDPNLVWPSQNEIDIAIQEIVGVKIDRDNDQAPLTLPYSKTVRQYRVTVVGRPELSMIQGMMIGVRNPVTGSLGSSKSICIWANELRVTGFTKNNGWAANAYLNAKIADLAVFSGSIRHNSIGFGGLETRLSQRTRFATTQYDLSGNIEVNKLLPEALGVSIPMYVSIENSTTRPEYDPLNPDVPFELALGKFETDAERDAYRAIALDQTERKNISLNNVKKIKSNPEAPSRIYDLSNFAFSYAVGSVTQTNAQLENYNFKTTRGNITYSFQPKEWKLAPFESKEGMSSPYLKLIKDFNLNLAPTLLLARVDLDRRFLRSQYRNDQLSTAGVDPLFQKSFFMNRSFNINWDLSQNLRFDLESRAMAVIDEPEGDLDTEAKRDSVRSNILRFGRTTNYNHVARLNYTIPFSKLPITDWIQADYRLEASYTWLTGAIGQKDTLGNVIQNTRDQSLNGKLDLIKLYNKNKKLAALNAPKRPSIPGRPSLSAEDTIGTPLSNKVVKFLMMVKELTFNYQVVEGTFLPGYMPNTGLLGMDRAWQNPGWAFIFGSQNPNVRLNLAQNGLMAPSAELTQTFKQNRLETMRFTGLAEPFRDFRVTLEASKRQTGDYFEIFRNSLDNPGEYLSVSPNRLGSYSISMVMLKTSFDRLGDQNTSALFTNFENYRSIIKQRLDGQSTEAGEFGLNGQDVMIPAFLAAYTGKDPNSMNLNPFPKTPLPNWRVDYRGLSRLKGLSDIFSSINITHGYSSSYDVSNFSNSLQYQEGLELFNTLQEVRRPNFTNEEGLFIPIFILNQVVLSERFTPLIGVDVLTKDRLNVAVNYNKERNLGLNFSNSQVTEQKTSDFTLTFQYTKAGVKVPFKIQGGQKVLKNDLQMRLDTKVANTIQVQRKIGQDATVTNGNLNLQIRPTLNYVINQNLNLTIYFERTINDPQVTTAFRRTSTAFGGQLRFNLSQ